MTSIQIPKAFEPLFKPKRYKIFYGGRGGAKSHNIARALLVLAMQNPIRVLCVREIQKSIDQSVMKLLSDLINEYKLGFFFEVQKTTIKGKNGSEFLFAGLKGNEEGIKSTEGVDICWVEEAANVSHKSWESLIPTIRKQDSEIWVSFNPRNVTDPVYERFILFDNPDRIYKSKVSYRDNPFFPKVLDDERADLLKRDPIAYKHVWEGELDERRTGTIYANYVDAAIKDGRVTQVPKANGSPVITAWDLGKSDATCIWFAQVHGLQVRIIDYYENSGQDLGHYAQVIRQKGYDYKMHYLPHDAAHERLGAVGSISMQLTQMGIANRVLKMSSIAARIELGRSLLTQAYIDAEKCKDGIHALMNYKYEWKETRQRFSDAPLHDWASDPADAFGYLAQALEVNPVAKPKKQNVYNGYAGRPSGGSWMSM